MNRLLQWYDNQKIEFPWRANKDPYRIWISEVMLQQTQVNTVVPYYNKWMKKFPDIFSIAHADISDIFKLWEGLGYYSRAHNIKKACNIIVHEKNGKFPSSAKELKKLPGIGEYICSAILSIAFNQSLPSIDGNIKRVCSRYWAENYIKVSQQRKLLKKLNDIIDCSRPGCFNQAMMDLGREVCKPQNPECSICPVVNQCEAFRKNKVHLFPAKKKKRKIPSYNVVVGFMLNAKEEFLITKRPVNKMLGGLWELPGGKANNKEELKEALAREIKEELDVTIKVNKKLGMIQHSYSHMKIMLHGYYCSIQKGDLVLKECDDARWIKLHNIKDYAFPKASHKLFELMKGYHVS